MRFIVVNWRESTDVLLNNSTSQLFNGDMSRIRLLPETVASQVAAGEVVERPGSVVKELVENSIDAGAQKIDVFVRRGGVSFIRVIDDGCGMDRDDALLSLERHATSKIRSADDLAAVATLGFRGEAVPSIASVSRFRLTTRESNAIAGTEIIVNGGKIDVVRDAGEAPGTQIEVRSLFYNLPARRKFLRSENTESRNIEHQLHLQAIGHARVAFTYARDDKIVFQLPPAADLKQRIRDLYGPELVDRLLPVDSANATKVHVRGFIGQAGLTRQNSSQQLIFVNGRTIDSPLVSGALREGYHTALMKGQYPVTFLFLDVDPADVDVNVHPAKREVRFRDPTTVREAIARTIQQTLESARSDWQDKFRPPVVVAGAVSPGASLSASTTASPFAPDERVTNLTLRPEIVVPHQIEGELPISGRGDSHAFADTLRRCEPNRPRAIEVNRPYPPEPEIPGGSPRGQQFQIIGVLNQLYILMENADGLVLVDQHAAHERILFEELRRRMEEQGVPSQRLLMSQTFDLPPRDADWVEQNMSTLQKMGIGIEGFGPNTFRIDSLPQFLNVSDPAEFMRTVIDDLKSASRTSSPLRLGEDMIATTVCRHAVKANDPLRYPEIEKLIQDLLECELPYCCPHGRPTMIQISHAELEKKFGRKV
jgi:DNA mismatch repair protein MutL